MLEHLALGEVELVRRLPTASNAVFQARLGSVRRTGESGLCVYKPAAGERPLWDFPGAVLAKHEVAAFQVSEALGWSLVPPTVWREDLPAGPGVLQAWVDRETTSDVALVAPANLAPGWLAVLRGEDEQGREVVLAHRDTERLADMALFDIVINNADRKAGHLLGDGASAMAIDHGVAFHPEWKVRTVLWGFAGTPLSPRALTALEGLHAGITAGQIELTGIPAAGVRAIVERIEQLQSTAEFPMPRPGWPVVPWPLW